MPHKNLRRAALGLLAWALAAPAGGCAVYGEGSGLAQAPKRQGDAKSLAPLFEKAYYGTAYDEVKAVLRKVVDESGLIGEAEANGYTLRMKAELLPGQIPLWNDVVNVLSVFFFPKIRTSDLRLTGVFVRDGRPVKEFAVKVDEVIESYELWLPLAFYPPAWPTFKADYGDETALQLYEEMAHTVLLKLHGIRDNLPPPETSSSGSSEPEVQTEACGTCGEQRPVDEQYCPHCGME